MERGARRAGLQAGGWQRSAVLGREQVSGPLELGGPGLALLYAIYTPIGAI